MGATHVMEPASLLCVLAAVAGVPLVLAVLVLTNYNALVRGRNAIRESWADVDTELKRRYDLIPNLVATVQGYAAHERETLQRVTDARTRAVASQGSADRLGPGLKSPV